jgi:hypothetical protein
VRRLLGGVVAVSSRREFRLLARQLRAGVEPARPVWLRAADWVLRYMPELLAAAVMVWLWLACTHVMGAYLTAALWLGVSGAALWWPPSRRSMLTALGLAVTRFRLRTALLELRLTNRAGRLPLLLWLAPTPVGERVWLWLRAGISAEDIAEEIDGIRAACVARDVRVTRDPRWGAVVVLDVIRRDPLAASVIVTSPLVDQPRARRRRWRRRAHG